MLGLASESHDPPLTRTYIQRPLEHPQGRERGQRAGWLRCVTPMLTNVYVDGFNLCYGCLKGTP